MAKRGRKPRQAHNNGKAQRATTGGGGRGGGGVIGQLRQHLAALHAQRAEVDNQIQALESSIQVLSGGRGMARGFSAGRPAMSGSMSAGRMGGGGGGGRGRGGRRAPGETLRDYIERVLEQRGSEMTVKEVTEAVMNEGYPSRNQTLNKSVGVTLAKMNNVVKLGRGRFRLR